MNRLVAALAFAVTFPTAAHASGRSSCGLEGEFVKRVAAADPQYGIPLVRIRIQKAGEGHFCDAATEAVGAEQDFLIAHSMAYLELLEPGMPVQLSKTCTDGMTSEGASRSCGGYLLRVAPNHPATAHLVAPIRKHSCDEAPPGVWRTTPMARFEGAMTAVAHGPVDSVILGVTRDNRNVGWRFDRCALKSNELTQEGMPQVLDRQRADPAGRENIVAPPVLPLPPPHFVARDLLVFFGKAHGRWLAERPPAPVAHRYDVKSAQWFPLPQAYAPSAPQSPLTLVLGHRLLVLGGSQDAPRPGGTAENRRLADGALYDAITDAWTPISSTGAPPGTPTAIVQIGEEVGVFTVADRKTHFGVYDPVKNAWRRPQQQGVPQDDFFQLLHWTGDELLVWPRFRGGRRFLEGAAYNPKADAWRALPRFDRKRFAPAGGSPLEAFHLRGRTIFTAVCRTRERQRLFVLDGAEWKESKGPPASCIHDRGRAQDAGDGLMWIRYRTPPDRTPPFLVHFDPVARKFKTARLPSSPGPSSFDDAVLSAGRVSVFDPKVIGMDPQARICPAPAPGRRERAQRCRPVAPRWRSIEGAWWTLKPLWK